MKLIKIKRGDYIPTILWDKPARIGAATRLESDPKAPQCIPLGGSKSNMWLELDREEIRNLAKLDRILDAMEATATKKTT